MEDETSTKEANSDDCGFMDSVISWSIEDILNEDLYKNKVEKIELSFQSIGHYLGSFYYPLLEETRAQLSSSMEIIYKAPYAEVIGLVKDQEVDKLYRLKINSWKSSYGHHGEPYKTSPDDVLILADYKPQTVEDLQRVGRTWSFVSVVRIKKCVLEDRIMSPYIEVKTSKDIDTTELRQKPLFLVFLTNVSHNRRIWDEFHVPRNLKLVKQILCTTDEVEECGSCGSLPDDLRDDPSYQRLLSELNESQNKAISACLSGLNCNHNSAVKLIWGPPGTGKTKTLGTLLFALLRMNYRVLVCAPTNVAIKEVASRVLAIVKESHIKESGDLFCTMGDLLLIGNNERLKIGEDIQDIYLDHRVELLKQCFASSTGLRSCVNSIMDLLENCVSYYHIFVEDELKKEMSVHKSFLDFLRERFCFQASPLKSCISIMCTHVAICHLLEMLFFYPELPEKLSQSRDAAIYQLHQKRAECLTALITVKASPDSFIWKKYSNMNFVREFCFRTSKLIFSTVAGSYKLHSLYTKPLNFLVIDEAAQLKDCESITPMLFPGISHAILVGDECQLPSMVRSNVCYGAGYGRSLFQRLSLLGHPKYLLNMQYRMHPQISSFPNLHFYFNKIQDAPNVKRNDYRKPYLPGPMFGPYSFINITRGKEKFDDAGRSYKNMAEVAVVATILKKMHKVWLISKEKLSIGIVSPYAGQVTAIKEELEQTYDGHYGFHVNVKSIDGFQGGEQDVIILTTVRTNNRTSLEFISSPQRTNVALTRARHCLWILGNERALTNNENVWKAIVHDAKSRKCFFNADQDYEMAKAILDAREESDQFDDFLDTNSVHFKNALWKLHFSDKFLRSFKRLRSEAIKRGVINLLKRLSRGWRPKSFTMDLSCENSTQILKQFKVESFYVICSIEIVKASRYIQVLKIWDILPLEDIPQLAKHLENVFKRYTVEYISRCKCKEKRGAFVGNTEIPLSWPLSANIIKFKNAYDIPN
uniref:Helicase sen1 n=1 Tax=Cajanus cajan TaxID=3821 RepID=A0A151R2L3_CAJCA|nr:Helicase sen1 [Cajanus cajan]